jgi:hypothetical protein
MLLVCKSKDRVLSMYCFYHRRWKYSWNECSENLANIMKLHAKLSGTSNVNAIEITLVQRYSK